VNLKDEIKRTELFKDVDDDILDSVLQGTQERHLDAGDVLLSPLLENHHVYLILAGSFGVHFGSHDSPEIRLLGKGVTVGEMSIIDQNLPSAFVIAREHSKVLPIHSSLIHNYLAGIHPVARNLLVVLTRWIRANTESMLRHQTTIGELTNHATTDALTGLYNRRWLNNILPALLDQAILTGEPLAILLLDVDHFKRYNDNLGHLAGDQALIAIGNCLKNSVRTYDYAIRYGGEEFLILLPNTALQDAIQLAERIRETVEQNIILDPEGKGLPGVTISGGLVVHHPDSTTKTLIDGADAKMYQAKQQGRNCIRY
jgi:diguanylate cyclase (GGDEF)-like protein